MTEPGSLAATVAIGAALGWSVAWPPGPINAEMVRRGLTDGFWSAYAVGLGACSADFLWALAVTLGAGAAAELPGVRWGLAGISFVLLLLLAWTFLRKAWHPIPRTPPSDGERPALRSGRTGALLGFSMALASPWNIAFWLAVVGHQAGTAPSSLLRSLVLAASVVGAAATWGLVLCSAVHFGARFATPRWETVTNGATGLLMLYFAIDLAVRSFG